MDSMRRRWTTLALREADPAVAYARLADRLLVLVGDVAPEAARLDTGEFRRRLERFREGIVEAADVATVETLSRECLRACRRFFERAARALGERDKELAEVIRLLREALGELSGEGDAFHDDLLRSTDRLAEMIALEDIGELKRRIAEEVGSIKRLVAERHERDRKRIAELAERVERLEGRLRETEREAELDPLTEIPNRRSLDRVLASWIESFGAEKAPFVLALVDIDDFKGINDLHGHGVGDRVLKGAAQLLAQAVRGNDFVARYGGEEFVVLLRGAELDGATSRFEALATEIARSRFDYEEGGEPRSLRFTVSVGLAEMGRGDDAASLLRRADEALYQAKRRGKNRVVAKKKRLLGRL